MSLLGAYLTLMSLLGPLWAGKKRWRLGPPRPGPSKCIPPGLQFLLSSPSLQEEMLTQLWKQVFLQDV